MKMYQAIDETVCIKEFGPVLLPGWYATTKEALAAKNPDPVAEIATNEPETATPKRRGRPPKDKA